MAYIQDDHDSKKIEEKESNQDKLLRLSDSLRWAMLRYFKGIKEKDHMANVINEMRKFLDELEKL